ncbi:hypothetical protein NKR19_g10391, partial [Coniochaeta hoffmannii]
MATDGEPLIMSASEVASAPPAVQVYLNKLRRQQRDRALSTKSVQLAKVPIVEVSPPSLPSGVDSTAVETKTRVEALIHELLLLVPDELGHVLKGHVASPAVWAADSHDNNGASKSALPLQEPKQLPPTSELRQQSGTMEKAPDGIALEPAAKQSSTERVPAACPVQQGGETKPANAQEQEPIDVDMFASDWTDTPQSLPKLAGPDTEQLEALVSNTANGLATFHTVRLGLLREPHKDPTTGRQQYRSPVMTFHYEARRINKSSLHARDDGVLAELKNQGCRGRTSTRSSQMSSRLTF